MRLGLICAAMGMVLSSASICPVAADLVFDSGHSTFDDTYPLAHEVWVINNAVLDVVGGEIAHLGTRDFATVNLYSGAVDWLWTGEWGVDRSVVNVYGGDINWLAAYKDSVVNLYAYDVQFHPTGGGDWGSNPWMEGTYYGSKDPFTLWFYNDDAYSHVKIVPEPPTFLVLGFGLIFMRKRGH